MKRIVNLLKFKFDDKSDLIFAIAIFVLSLLAYRGFIKTEIVNDVSFGTSWLGYIIISLPSFVFACIELFIISGLYYLAEYFILGIINQIKEKDYSGVLFRMFVGFVFVFFFHFIILIFFKFFIYLNFQIK